MSYRLVDLEGHLSPCPNEIWQTRESAEQGLVFWERESGMKLKIVGDTIEPEYPGAKRAEL